MAAKEESLDIDDSRLIGRLRNLAKIGRETHGGLTRPGFGEADMQARRALRAMAADAGLQSWVDTAGNVLFRKPGCHAGSKTLLIGSHLDTVVNGGWLDGAYGVVSALETVETLHQHRIDLGFDVVGVAFANEEGALFPQAFWGSKALSGSLESVTLPVVDYFGNSLEPILARAGGDIRQLDRAAWDKDSILGYLELHIEQGPVLESAGLSIGIVDSIVGRTVTEVEIMGVPGHAGTTPMEHRRDALATAARIIEFVEELPREPNGCRVATVGRLECFPNSANTISGRVKFTVDLRDANSIRLRQAETRLIGWSRHLARSRGVELRSSALVRSDPASADRGIRDYIAMATRSAGLDFQVMSSGAGHDAQILARITASGMIFVPSIAGVSHVPEENTSETDLVAGARVLFGTVLKIAGDS